MARADADGGGDTIVFSSLFDAPQTIKLTGGYNPLTLNDSATTTITGPGANLLTISGGGGGKVFSVYGSADLSGLTITGGYGDFSGGLSSTGTTVLTNCTIAGNSGVYGGGLFNANGTLTLDNCTVAGNSTSHLGGGLDNAFGGTTSLTNCTVSGNFAGDGGGLENFDGTLSLTDCTVTGNAAVEGGGLNNQGSLTLTNTIVAGQESGGDIAGGFTDGGGNLIGGDPLLAPLGDYGGPTPTVALLPGSPAIGKGVSGPGVPATDQRGQPRSGRIDIGAFQSQGAGIVVNDTADEVLTGPGQLSLRAAVDLANVLATAETISFDPQVFGTMPHTITLTAGPLVLTDPATTNIIGPGANLLTVSGNSASRVFDMEGGSAARYRG